MFLFSLLWLALGLVVGALALAAKLRPTAWGRRGWLLLLAVGALSGLLGGWLGALLLGKMFGTPEALWIAILAVALPSLVERLRASVLDR
jgi:ABC-type molybdate transport system permease subunit